MTYTFINYLEKNHFFKRKKKKNRNNITQDASVEEPDGCIYLMMAFGRPYLPVGYRRSLSWPLIVPSTAGNTAKTYDAGTILLKELNNQGC